MSCCNSCNSFPRPVCIGNINCSSYSCGGRFVPNMSGPIGGPVGPTGATGATGSAATVTVGTTTTGLPGSQASVTNSGTASNAVLNFTVPQGPTGPQGEAATITVGDVTGGAAGSDPIVENVGTPTNAILNFTLPAGPTGATGPDILPAYLRASSSSSSSVAANNGAILFDNDDASQGVTLETSSGIVTVEDAGFYLVYWSVTATPGAAAEVVLSLTGTAGDIGTIYGTSSSGSSSANAVTLTGFTFVDATEGQTFQLTNRSTQTLTPTASTGTDYANRLVFVRVGVGSAV